MRADDAIDELLAGDPHACRWARRKIKRMFDMDWSRWHWTTDGSFTLCGVPIPIGLDGGTMFPETDELPAKVDCRKCRRRLSQGGIDG